MLGWLPDLTELQGSAQTCLIQNLKLSTPQPNDF